MVTALLSLATNTPVRPKLSMTGEVTLTGKVKVEEREVEREREVDREREVESLGNEIIE